MLLHNQRMIGMLLILSFLLSFPAAYAAEAAPVALEPIGPAQPGDTITVKGTTELEQVMVRVRRPNGTMLVLDLVPKRQFEEGVRIALPDDAPVGAYTATAGVGDGYASASFAVTRETGGGGDGGTGGGDGGSGGGDDDGSVGAPPRAQEAAAVGAGFGREAGAVVVTIAASAPDAAGVSRAAATREMLDEAIAMLAPGAFGKIVLDLPHVTGASAYVQTLPASVLPDGRSTWELELRTAIGTIAIPPDVWRGLDATSAELVELKVAAVDPHTLTESERAVVGSRPVVELTLRLDGEDAKWTRSGARIAVSMPYEPTAEERRRHSLITVFSLNDDGRATPVSNSKHDPETGMTKFYVRHFSRYGVAFPLKSFDDLNGHEWARQAVELLASKGIVSGVSAADFAPGADIKRGDFVRLLVRTLDLDADVQDGFADVEEQADYYEAIGVAKRLGIVQGVGGNRFLPERDITRQEWMTLTARALRIASLGDDEADVDLSVFADVGTVAPYALESIRQLVGSGIIVGDGGLLRPEGTATRAETAVMLRRIYEWEP